MPKISKKEVDKFMKENPNAPATQAIKKQLEETPAPEPSTNDCSGLAAGPAQIRNTASYLTAQKVNGLHREVLEGLKDMCIKAIEIGEILVPQKDSLKHGEWLDWIEAQLEIGPRQVENYMRIYRRKEAVLESMQELAENSIKPSFRKMLMAAIDKDNQTVEEFRQECEKDESYLTAKERRQRRKDKKRENEISTLANMYMDKEIDDNSLRALVMKWNMDNPDNSRLFIEEIKTEARQMDEELYPDIFNTNPSLKTNVMLSVDADVWDDFVKFGGGEAYLDEYVNEFLTNYVTEQRSYRIAN